MQKTTQSTLPNTEKKRAHVGIYFKLPQEIKIYILSEHQDNKPDQLEVKLTNCQSIVYSLLGKPFSHPDVQSKIKQHPQIFSEDQNDQFFVKHEGKKIHPTNFLSKSLQKVKSKVDQKAYSQKYTFCFPTSYQQISLKQLKNAVQKAKIRTKSQYLREQEAVMIKEQYQSWSNTTYSLICKIGKQENYISLKEIKKKLIKNVTIFKIQKLNGNHFDKLLAQYFAQLPQIKKIQNGQYIMDQVKRQVQKAKRDVNNSLRKRAQIYINYHGQLIRLTLQLNAFEQLINDIVELMKKEIHIKLSEAKIKPKDIKQVILVGSSTHILKINGWFRKQFQYVKYADRGAEAEGLIEYIKKSYKKSRNYEIGFEKISEKHIMENVCKKISVKIQQYLNQQNLKDLQKNNIGQDYFSLYLQSQFKVMIKNDTSFQIHPYKKLGHISISKNLIQRFQEIKKIIQHYRLYILPGLIVEELKKRTQMFLQNFDINFHYLTVKVSLNLYWNKDNNEQICASINATIEELQILPPTSNIRHQIDQH